MKTFEDVFSVLLHNYSSKKLKQLVLPSLLGREGERLLCAKDINRFFDHESIESDESFCGNVYSLLGSGFLSKLHYLYGSILLFLFKNVSFCVVRIIVF
jgi:hypothetical protein